MRFIFAAMSDRKRNAPRRARPASGRLMARFRASLSEPIRQLQLSVLLLFALVGVGTLGYSLLVPEYGIIDALYMTVITITTVGFGEVRPLTAEARIFTMFLIISGVGTGAWAASNAIEVILGQTFWISVQRRRIKDMTKHIRDHYIVCGWGRLGRQITRDLDARGEPYVVVDTDDGLETELLEDRVPHVLADATDEDTLMEAGVERARGLVAALDSDANNVMAVLTARDLKPDLLIVARANSETSESRLRRAGADRVVTPETIGGHRLALALLRPAVHDFFGRIVSFGQNAEVDVGQIPIAPTSPIAGQTISRCDLRRVRNVSILAIRTDDGEFDLTPDAKRVIQGGDTLIVIGPAEAVYELEALYGGDEVTRGG